MAYILKILDDEREDHVYTSSSFSYGGEINIKIGIVFS